MSKAEGLFDKKMDLRTNAVRQIQEAELKAIREKTERLRALRLAAADEKGKDK